MSPSITLNVWVPLVVILQISLFTTLSNFVAGIPTARQEMKFLYMYMTLTSIFTINMGKNGIHIFCISTIWQNCKHIFVSVQYCATFCVNDNLKISLKRYQNDIEIYLAGHKMNVYIIYMPSSGHHFFSLAVEN